MPTTRKCRRPTRKADARVAKADAHALQSLLAARGAISRSSASIGRDVAAHAEEVDLLDRLKTLLREEEPLAAECAACLEALADRVEENTCPCPDAFAVVASAVRWSGPVAADPTSRKAFIFGCMALPPLMDGLGVAAARCADASDALAAAAIDKRRAAPLQVALVTLVAKSHEPIG